MRLRIDVKADFAMLVKTSATEERIVALGVALSVAQQQVVADFADIMAGGKSEVGVLSAGRPDRRLEALILERVRATPAPASKYGKFTDAPRGDEEPRP